MRSRNERNDLLEGSSYREYQVLSEVETRPDISQRELSKRLGIALGLTNMLLRNLAQKGYIRLNRSHWKRWIYAITPEGFSHKIRLTAAYIARVLDHYRQVRQTLREQLEPLGLNKESRVAIYGVTEFAELVYLGLREIGLEDIEVFSADDHHGGAFLGMPVRDIASIDPEQYERIVVTYLDRNLGADQRLLDLGVPLEKLVTFFKDGKTEGGG